MTPASAAASSRLPTQPSPGCITATRTRPSASRCVCSPAPIAIRDPANIVVVRRGAITARHAARSQASASTSATSSRTCPPASATRACKPSWLTVHSTIRPIVSLIVSLLADAGNVQRGAVGRLPEMSSGGCA